MNSQTEKSSRKILIIEDDPEISDLLNLHLGDMNYDVTCCNNGLAGLEQAMLQNPDLVILDLMLPDMDGFEICREIRKTDKYMPILILSSRSEEIDRVLGLELGADDYLTKPFSIRELQARVKAIFRRVEALDRQAESDTNHQKKICCCGLEVDFTKRRVSLEGQPVELTVKEFDLLEIFMRHPGRPYSRQDLLENVWGYTFTGYDHTVNSHINRLRAKIEKDPGNPRYIKTVWGLGYRFAETEELAE